MLVVPLTLAVNCCVPPANSEAETGETATEIGEVTVAEAEADLVLSAALMAVIV